MTFDGEETLSIAAIREEDVGSHFITIRVSLEGYPSVSSLDKVLEIIIESCNVDSISFTSIPKQNYGLFLPHLTF